jgi:hypothetical protein
LPESSPEKEEKAEIVAAKKDEDNLTPKKV